MKKSIVALLISAGVLTGCAQYNATESVATLAEKVDEATEEAFYNYVFGSGNYEPRDADALGTAVAKYVMDDVIISIIDDYDHVYECDVENTNGEIIKVSGDIWYDEGH